MSFDEIAPGVWTTAREQRFWGLETGTRMTLVRLGARGLLVHCPVALDEATRTEVEALGEVQAVAATSLYHHLYVGDWMRAYPRALFAACPGLQRKRADLAWSLVLGDTPRPEWAAELDQLYFSARFEHEVVLFHRATGTLVCADALLNLSRHPSRATRAAARLMGNTAPGKGYLERVAVQDWRQGRREVDRMLEWDTKRIVLAHGALVPEHGRETLREAYAWL